jgi:hypothetical protein
MEIESASLGGAPEIIFTAQEKSHQVTITERHRLERLETEVAGLRGELCCPRCSTPAPPPPRWPGDPHARDERAACSCGRARAWTLL